jgi:hypothetical protein
LYVEGTLPTTLFLEEGIDSKIKETFPDLSDVEIRKLKLSVLIEIPEKAWLPLSDCVSSK